MMNKSELVAALAEKTGATKKGAEESLNALVEIITESLVKGDKVQLVGFGSFEVRKEQQEKEEIHKLKKKLKYQLLNHLYLRQEKR